MLKRLTHRGCGRSEFSLSCREHESMIKGRVKKGYMSLTRLTIVTGQPGSVKG